jgi:hypothetical protein
VSLADRNRDVCLLLGAGAVVLRDAAGGVTMREFVRPDVGVLVATAPDLHSAQAMLGEGLSDAEDLRVIISDSWLAAAEIPWADALLTMGASDYVNMHFSLIGINGADMRVVIDDAPAKQPRLALAMTEALHQDIAVLASSRGLTLRSITPLSLQIFAAVRHRIASSVYGLAVIEDSVLTLMVIGGGRVRQLRTHRHAGDWARDLQALWRRLKLRDPALADIVNIHAINLSTAGASDSTGIQLLDVGDPWQACAAAEAGSALEFIQRPPAVRRWHWAAAAVLAILIGASAWVGLSARQDMSETDAALQALDQSRAAPIVVRSGAARRYDDQQLAAARRELAALDVPVDRLLQAVLPPPQVRATLLSFEMTAPRDATAAATVRLTGEARGGEAMTEYLQHLGNTAPFVAAQLTRHEVVGAQAYQFTMEATWKR